MGITCTDCYSLVLVRWTWSSFEVPSNPWHSVILWKWYWHKQESEMKKDPLEDTYQRLLGLDVVLYDQNHLCRWFTCYPLLSWNLRCSVLQSDTAISPALAKKKDISLSSHECTSSVEHWIEPGVVWADLSCFKRGVFSEPLVYGVCHQ